MAMACLGSARCELTASTDAFYGNTATDSDSSSAQSQPGAGTRLLVRALCGAGAVAGGDVLGVTSTASNATVVPVAHWRGDYGNLCVEQSGGIKPGAVVNGILFLFL